MRGLVVFVVILLAALAGCAAIGGLGDFQQVDCVGPDCADGGTDDGGLPPPPPGTVRIGGNVTGLLGTGLVLQDNGGDDLPITGDGPFTFAIPVGTGNPYAVTVASQPQTPSQTCIVDKGSGVAPGVDVTDVTVKCDTAAYSVGGAVVGLSGGTGLVLTNNGGDDLPIGSSGGIFTFPTKIPSGAAYDVQVKTQPTGGGPCVVSGGTGTMGEADVAGIVVNCAPGTYTVGGTISGLVGRVVLQNNAGNNLTLTSNGTFAFSTTLAPGAPYAVTVLTQPVYYPRAQTCTVTNGTGTMGSANVTNITVACVTKSFTVGGIASGLTGSMVLRNNLTNNLTVPGNGSFTFTTPILSGSAYSVTVLTPPAGETCLVVSGAGIVGNGNVTTVRVVCDQGILCGGPSCPPASQTCCHDPATTAGACVANGDNCSGGTVPMTCDDSLDCGGGANVCCAGFTNAGVLKSASCVTSAALCVPQGAAVSVKYLCDPNAIPACPAPKVCTLDATHGWHACQ